MGDEPFKSFGDFVRLACRTYHLEYEEATNFIQQQLKKWGLNPRVVVSYVNWASLGYSTRQIGRYLKINQAQIVRDLQKVRQVWPHLFRFGLPIPKIQDMSKLPEDFDEYLEEGHNVEKF